VRGGAIPVFAWGTILLVLYIGHAIWDARTVQIVITGFAVLAIYGLGLVLWLAHREAIRRGPPEQDTGATPAPSASAAAASAGFAIACILFGFVWSTFLVYFGAAVLLFSAGRALIELRAQRASAERVQR